MRKTQPAINANFNKQKTFIFFESTVVYLQAMKSAQCLWFLMTLQVDKYLNVVSSKWAVQM